MEEVLKALPNFHYAYVADFQNCPYGNKRGRKLRKIGESLVRQILLKISPKIIVLACNTLTTNVISHLRKKFPNTIFVGTVPAVKPALKKGEEILLFATKATIAKTKKNNKIKTVFIKNLPFLIDKTQNLDDLNKILIKNLEKYKNIEHVVLGCTHFLRIKSQLKNIFNKKTIFYDSCEGVSKQLKLKTDEVKIKKKNLKIQFFIRKNNILIKTQAKNSHEFRQLILSLDK